MTQTEKNNIKFEKHIQNMREMLKAFQNKRKESCSILDAEVRDINQHIEVETSLCISFMIHYKLFGKQAFVKNILFIYFK